MGGSLSKAVTSTVVERHGSKRFRVGLAEMNGWRGSMEDAHVAHMTDGWGFFGILDGHGGSECSKWCAQKLDEKLSMEGCPKTDDAAKKLMLDVDQAFLNTSQSSGSTAAMCAVWPPAEQGGGGWKLHVINAGDSRVLLSRADGSIVDGGGTDRGLTIDHKPDNPSERERIERCGGEVKPAMGGVMRVNGDLAVSRGFGDAEYKKTGGVSLEDRPVTASPEMGHFEADESDFLLLVCDGVSEGEFPNAEVCKLAAKVLKETGGDAARASEAVIEMALECGSKDNISCMIVLFGRGGGSGKGRNHRMEVEATFPIGAKQVEFHPGGLVGCDNPAFMKAYTAMCERGGVSVAQAAEQRYTLLLARRHTSAVEEDDDEELALIGDPEGTAGSPERAAWFTEWVRDIESGRGEAGSPGGPRGAGLSRAGIGGGAAGLDPAQKMEMLRMLLGAMHSEQEDMMDAGGGGGGLPGRGRGRGGAGRGGAGRATGRGRGR